LTTILLADDHEISLAGIKNALEAMPEIKIVGEATNGLTAIQLAKELSPDIIFMDILMPEVDGIEATRRILHFNPKIKIIILSIVQQNPYPARLLEAGVSGYLPKNCPADEIITAVKSVLRKNRYLNSAIARQLIEDANQPQRSSFNLLSLREFQVALMLIEGKTIQLISRALGIKPKTVADHRYKIFKKCKVANDVEFILLAWQTHQMLSFN
jgi:DNA-binding NarL/FixJ family response regulator